MPRTARAAVGGYCYHVLNRGNGRATVFHDEDDYAAFTALVRAACARVPMRVLAYCVMPNHFHLVLWPAGDEDLAWWMHWLLTSHVARHRKRYRTSGHIWQGRFKAFPIQEDTHLLIVLRYVERNPLRANLVVRAEMWRWSSLCSYREPGPMPWLHPGPVPRSADWLEHVNQPQTEAELERLRRSVQRGSPYGAEQWVNDTAARLGLVSTLRPGLGGRPRKQRAADAAERPELWGSSILECPGFSVSQT
jgi:putative transposase